MFFYPMSPEGFRIFVFLFIYVVIVMLHSNSNCVTINVCVHGYYYSRSPGGADFSCFYTLLPSKTD